MARDLELALRIKADVKAARDELGRFTKGVDDLGKATRRPFGDPTRLLVTGAKGAVTALGNLRRAVFSVQGALVGLGAGLVAKGFLDVSRELENIQVRMRFLTGSTREAAEATRLLTQYAAQSPSTLQEITAAAPNLLVVAQDLTELNRLLQITGDLAAVSGLSFGETAEQIQRAMSAGAASADLFQQRGVNAMLGFQAGVSVSAEDTKRIIMDLWFGPGSATNTLRGAAGEMAKTWDGLISMQMDRWDQFRRAVMDGGPFEFLKASLQELDAQAAESFGSLEEAGRQMGRDLVQMFQHAAIGAAGLADDLSGVGKAGADAIGDIWGAFRQLPTELQTVGIFAALAFGKKGALAVGGILAGINAIREATTQTIDQINEAVRASGVEPPTTLFPQPTNQASGEIQRTGAPPPAPDEGLDPDSFEARTRRLFAAINARIEANRAAAAAEAGDTGGGGGGRRGGAAGGTGDAATKAAQQRADAIAKIIDSLREQAATEGMTTEQVALYRLAQQGADAATLARAQALIGTIQLTRDEAAAMEASRQAAERQAEAIHQARMADQALLEDLAAELYLITLSERARAQETAERRLSAEATDEQRAAVRALAGALYDQQEAARQTGEQMSEFAVQAARNMQTAFADFLFDPFSEGLDGMLRGFVDTLRRMASEALAAKIGEALFGSLAAGGAGAAAGGGGTGLIGGLLSGLFHTGGIAGQASAHRELPALAFLSAPRFHSGGIAGLAADEMPAILRRDEEVLTRDDPRHRFNLGGGSSEPPVVNIRNINAFDGATIRDEMSSAAGERVILNVVSRNKRLLGIG